MCSLTQFRVNEQGGPKEQAALPFWATLYNVAAVSCAPGESDCYELQKNGKNKSGVYTINVGPENIAVTVFCDMESDGGGWTVGIRVSQIT